jgi:hypothetical protein
MCYYYNTLYTLCQPHGQVQMNGDFRINSINASIIAYSAAKGNLFICALYTVANDVPWFVAHTIKVFSITSHCTSRKKVLDLVDHESID